MEQEERVDEGPASVCVVGAGVFGVAAARALSRRGLPFECFERGDEATDSPRLDVSRAYLQFRDWPMPASYPQLPGRRHLRRYLDEYAAHYDFATSIHRGVEVVAARPLADGGWEVELRPDGRRRFAALFAACAERVLEPAAEPPGEFGGARISGERAGPAELRGRDVIVVGSGREACEVAVAASYVARSTRLALERAPYVLPPIAFGKPIDAIPGLSHLRGKRFGRGRLARPLPRPLRRALLVAGYRAWTSPELHGLPSPAEPPETAGTVAGADLLERLLHGRIEVRPTIARLAGDDVVFADGTSAAADLIVDCGGRRPRVPFLPQALQPRTGDGELLFEVLPRMGPNLAFLGLVDAGAGSPTRIAEAQAELAVAVAGGDYLPPAREEAPGPAGSSAEAPGHRRGAHEPRLEQFEYAWQIERELRAGRRRARRRR